MLVYAPFHEFTHRTKARIAEKHEEALETPPIAYEQRLCLLVRRYERVTIRDAAYSRGRGAVTSSGQVVGSFG